MIKPKVVVSQCLEFDRCRYNGEVIPSKFVKNLQKYVTFIPVCPEVEIGLGIPREPIRIIEEDGQRQLYQPATQRNLTQKMDRFSRHFLGSLKDVDGFILKAGSPSCGISDVKIAISKENPVTKERSSGFFAAAVLENFEGLAIEDEGRLTNFRIREHFLTKLFALARFRFVKDQQKMAALVEFHSRNKLLFMAYNQAALKSLGRVVANADKVPIEEVCQRYQHDLYRVFARNARHQSQINVLMHALGYFKKDIEKSEKAFFLRALDDYREEKIPLSALTILLRSWVIKYKKDYLATQSYFEPFPEDLVQITDSGKGRSGRY